MPFPNIGAPELIIILIIALIVLGPGKLPDVASSLGKSVREFRRAAGDLSDAAKLEPDKPATPVAATPTQAGPPPVAPAAPVAAAAPVAPGGPVSATSTPTTSPQPNTLADGTAPNTLSANPAPTPVPTDNGDTPAS
jgi:TatA/E family protein of Tat protein translocase